MALLITNILLCINVSDVGRVWRFDGQFRKGELERGEFEVSEGRIAQGKHCSESLAGPQQYVHAKKKNLLSTVQKQRATTVLSDPTLMKRY